MGHATGFCPTNSRAGRCQRQLALHNQVHCLARSRSVTVIRSQSSEIAAHTTLRAGLDIGSAWNGSNPPCPSATRCGSSAIRGTISGTRGSRAAAPAPLRDIVTSDGATSGREAYPSMARPGPALLTTGDAEYSFHGADVTTFICMTAGLSPLGMLQGARGRHRQTPLQSPSKPSMDSE